MYIYLYIFTKTGQAYVALSRATSLKTLHVVNFFRDKVIVDRKVLDFYNQLSKGKNKKNQ